MDGDGQQRGPETMTKNAKEVVEEEPNLPLVSHQTNFVRCSILLAYWLIVLICLPIWWHMTSIERLSLPSVRIASQEQKIHELRFRIDILLMAADSNPLDKSFLDSVQDAFKGCSIARSEDWKTLDIKFISSPLEARGEDIYDVQVHFARRHGNHQVYGRNLDFFASDDAAPADLGQLLCLLLNPTAGQLNDAKTIQYSPSLRLAFSLLNEDITTSGQRGWAVERNIQSFIQPVLDQLSELHNFTVESQVQYYAPLAFKPRKRPSAFGDYYALGEDELKIFVNSAEWTLASTITNDPVLHFVLFAPAENNRPLLVYDERTDQPASRPSFVIPQWGGILLLNPGHPSSPRTGADIFSIFCSQLLSLLGVPSLPSNVELIGGPEGGALPLSEWQVDALMRRRTRENVEGAVQTLNSIVKLVDQLKNMPVGMDVKGDVLHSLEQLEEMHTNSVYPRNVMDLFSHSREALKLSSKAFFNPGMVGQLYFPAEHKYAIYMLFAPASMPLIVTMVKEIKRWIRSKRQKQKVD